MYELKNKPLRIVVGILGATLALSPIVEGTYATGKELIERVTQKEGLNIGNLVETLLTDTSTSEDQYPREGVKPGLLRKTLSFVGGITLLFGSFTYFGKGPSPVLKDENEINIYSPDIEELTRFYEKVFGWEAERRGIDPYTFCDGQLRIQESREKAEGTTLEVYVCSVDLYLSRIERQGGERNGKKVVRNRREYQDAKDPEGNPITLIGMYQVHDLKAEQIRKEAETI